MDAEPTTLPALLDRLAGDGEGAFAIVVDSIYEDIRSMAQARLHRRYGARVNGMTIQPTMLANDTLMELLSQREAIQNKEHCFALATRLMLRLISRYQRDRQALKRGAGDRGHALDGSEPAIAPATLALELEPTADRVVAAIEKLHEANPRCAEVATLRLFGEHPIPRIATVLGVSVPTIERDWKFARTYLRTALGE
ncbi:MAG: hypothetical protein KDA16_05840 [Phycisphaerales bacterium]|nr:hypothetical protein [Phycisphaerales bacterium]